MPITYNRGNVRKLAFRSRGRSAHSCDVTTSKVEHSDEGDGRFLQIKPAIADPRASLQRSNTTLSSNNYVHRGDGNEESIRLQAVGEGKVQLSRTQQEKDRLPDRISLDRRGLSSIPHIVGEPGLRLLSLQHNLINSLAGLTPLDLGKLVFLDVYDNQIDKINSLERLFSLRVLLMGKNRIKRIEGLSNLLKLEVLDLHGNRITKVGGLSNLTELKVLNLAGNQIKFIAQSDLQGLLALRELNLKRNRLKKLQGFQFTSKLQKLYLSNNDLQSVEDVSSLAEATTLIEVSLDGNPVALGGDCTPFLVSYLPNLVSLSNLHVTDQVRSAAMAWRNNKEAGHAAYCALSGSAQQAARRDQVINNARTNWELLRTENKCLLSPTSPVKHTESESDLCDGKTPDEKHTVETKVMPDVIVCAQPANESRNLADNSKTTQNDVKAKTPATRIQRSNTARKLSERRVNFSDRSASQDTDASHSTSTSSDLRLPPILLPIISSLESVKLADSNEPILKRWESISSVEPVIDSSFSSLPSTSTDSEEETQQRRLRRTPTVKRREKFSSMRSKSVCDPESRRIKNTKNIDNDNASNISSSTAVGSVASEHKIKRQGSLNTKTNNRNIRSATILRRSERSSSAQRASTGRVKSGKSLASLKSTEPIPKVMPTTKDREQGVDYLVEVNDGIVSAWGTGAVRRLAREWDWEKAQTVTKAAFHYVHFNAVAQSLPELKAKFPNVSHISVRATGLQCLGQLHSLAELRGLTSLTVLPEGNPICVKTWREYAIYRLAHWGLKEINEEQVTEEEMKSANKTYSGLSDLVLRALPDDPLQPLLSRLGRSGNSVTTAKAWLRSADPALRDVIAKEALQYKKGSVSQDDMSWRVRGRKQLSQAIEVSCGAAQRLRILEIQWSTIFNDMIEEILNDFADMDTHVKDKMRSLAETLH
ncbi:leucine-rich repeat-containing protein 49 isoform X1 [Pieris brassicae]|uniref:leucine-rich repeat-containing protein 49 isoform X1 n=1 Tax=Pieris brassicae TaxID=7116 RepID=UPI001E661207|nr:leucine-rich repeat-containing protein 49 isoform X1 [Pieris brassicae]